MPKFIPLPGSRKMAIMNDDGSLLLPWKFRPGHYRSTPGDHTSPVFTYIEHHKRKSWHWAMDALWKLIADEPGQYPLQWFTTTEEYFRHVALNNGIEFPHFERMRAQPGRLDEPGIMLVWNAKLVDGQFDGMGTVVDGNHRLALRYIEGKKDMQFYCMTERQARNAELDIPWELAGGEMFAHIPVARK